MERRTVLKLLRPFTKLHWQLALSLLLAVGAGWYASSLPADDPTLALAKPGQFVATLGVIGGILALASSISYGHLLQFINSGKSEFDESYHMLKQQLFELDIELDNADSEAEWISKARELSFQMKAIRSADLPHSSVWEDLVRPLMEDLTDLRDNDEWEAEHRHLVARLLYCEELLSKLGVASVKIVVASLPRQPVVKSMALLASIVLFGIGGFFLMEASGLSWLAIPTQLFFACFVALLFIETGYWVYRDTQELLETMI